MRKEKEIDCKTLGLTSAQYEFYENQKQRLLILLKQIVADEILEPIQKIEIANSWIKNYHDYIEIYSKSKEFQKRYHCGDIIKNI